ncbi:hypothetical protein WJX81_005717 [Elliptochloris bilobata]|uniref:Calnexin n=1 Tax=Elliptochloris bilobata TaxID=381761 RepID=A0AAW1RC42_9CHLO
MNARVRGLLAALGLLLISACAAEAAFFEEYGPGWDSRWIYSSDDKYSGRFEVEAPEGTDNSALKVPEKAKHYGITTKLDTEVDPADGLVLQYELKLSEGLTCGGAYLKYLTATPDFDPADLTDGTPYSIMFGPDKCGATNKVHLILRHKAPNGTIEEKHLKFPPSVELDKGTHVYTAILYPSNNSYAVLVDGSERKGGSLFEDFEPAFNPLEEVDDPEDSKPSSWVDTPKIPDPAAVKPDDWDEDAPKMIPDEDAEKPAGWLDDEPADMPDPESTQPEDWDTEEDGDWEAPSIPNLKCKAAPGCGPWTRPLKPNPEFKGKWSAALIDNPDYKGPWAPRKIPNPHYFRDDAPLGNLGKIGAAAIEIWTMDTGYFFDNVLVASDPAAAAAHRDSHWTPKLAVEAEIKAREEAEEKEKAEKAKAEAQAAESKEGSSKSLGQRIADLFDLPQLAPYKETAKPLLDALEEHAWLPFALLAAPVLLLLGALARLFAGGKKTAPVGPSVRAQKKQDVSVPDDTAPAAVPATAVPKVVPVAEVDGAVADADDDDEPVDTVKLRSRVRRAD